MRIFKSVTRAALASLIGLAASVPALAGNNKVLDGVLDIQRAVETAPVDGCNEVHKAISMSDEFMLIACEKVLPWHPISAQQAAADNYTQQLTERGWTQRARRAGERGQVYTKTDAMGCPVSVDVMVWTDRSMGEPVRENMSREDHRQIVFFTKFSGPKCQYRFDEVVNMAGPVQRS